MDAAVTSREAPEPSVVTASVTAPGIFLAIPANAPGLHGRDPHPRLEESPFGRPPDPSTMRGTFRCRSELPLQPTMPIAGPRRGLSGGGRATT
jgi:hypothetical protein